MLQPEHIALRDALQRRIDLIADHEWRDRDADAHLQALKDVSESIVEMQQGLPKPVHPQLKHFLDGCSYSKALAFLNAQK